MEKEPTNKPFADLPAFIRMHKIDIKKIAETPIGTSIKDDLCLLTDAMQGVKIIEEEKKRIMKKPAVRHFGQIPRDNNPQKLLEEAVQEENYRLNVTNMPEFMEGFVEGINPITMEKLRRGEFSVQKTLDLHGYSIDNANGLFQEFIKDTVREGLKCVKIIHGRGLKSKGGPVLKEHLKTWIVKAMHRKWVLAFSNAIMSDGGPGATYIILKKNPVKKHIHIIG
jgi:DNA-nicking Smr family endonuclease